MKDGDVKFVPDLPKNKLQALSKLGVSQLEKLFFEFDEVFWDNSVDLFNIFQDEWTLTMNCHKHNTGKPILCMFNYGKQCEKFATMGDDEVIASALSALWIMFPHAKHLKPKSYIRTNWLKDKYAKMCYTYNPVGSSLQEFDILGQSIS